MYLTTLVNVAKSKVCDAPYLIGCIVELTINKRFDKEVVDGPKHFNFLGWLHLQTYFIFVTSQIGKIYINFRPLSIYHFSFVLFSILCYQLI